MATPDATIKAFIISSNIVNIPYGLGVVPRRPYHGDKNEEG
jgi:hypothetical protein